MWKSIVTILLLTTLFTTTTYGWDEKKIKLKDVHVLTLHEGQMTTGRRSSPVPQLNCVGGKDF